MADYSAETSSISTLGKDADVKSAESSNIVASGKSADAKNVRIIENGSQ